MKTDDTAVPPTGSGAAVGLPGDPAVGLSGDPVVGFPRDPEPRERPAGLPFRAAFGLRDLGPAAVVALAAALVGVPMGAIWAALGPHASVVVTGEGAVIADHRQEAFIGADATFAGIAVVGGLVLGIAVYLWRRRRGPWMAIGVAVGALAGSYLAAKVGHQIGLSAYQRMLAREPGGPPFDRPVTLAARGALFLQPLVAVIVYVLAAGWSRFADLGRVAPEPAEAILSSGSAVPAARPAAPVPPPAGGASSPPA
jgi:hypothetical protein